MSFQNKIKDLFKKHDCRFDIIQPKRKIEVLEKKNRPPLKLQEFDLICSQCKKPRKVWIELNDADHLTCK